MASNDTTAPTGAAAAIPVSSPGVEVVLDAALAQFEEIGIRRSTIEDVARRAGIDRVTVYRRVGSKDDVIQAVLAREAGRLIEQVNRATTGLRTLEDRIAKAFATAITHLRENALYNRMLTLDADTVLPRITTEAAQLLGIGIAAAVELLGRAQADGLLDPGSDNQGSAEILVRLVQSFVLSPVGVVRLQTTAELEAFALTHLCPIIDRRSAGAGR